MLEAARLLRFTDLTVGEVARRVGYEDPLYFSRAFKRRHDEARRRSIATPRAGSPCIGDVLPLDERAPGEMLLP